jgi:hypothetical protein
MTYWGDKLTVDGTVIDLSHLEPFTFSITLKDFVGRANIHVKFNNHCFTEKLQTPTAQQVLTPPYGDGREARCFSRERYELSKFLPDLIKAFDGKSITRSSNDNLVNMS